MRDALRISDLAIGDHVEVTWYAGQTPLRGIVSYIVRNASRASGSSIRTASGQTVRIKSSMIIRCDITGQ